MCFARFALAALLLATVSCGAVGEDLAPSGEDKRGADAGAVVDGGFAPGFPDFTLYSIDGSENGIYGHIQSSRAVVLYFNMWCPICDGHMDHMMRTIAPANPDVTFVIVDYVSGSVKHTAAAAQASGYANTVFIVVTDLGHAMMDYFDATMASTVVMDASGSVVMNEDYKDGVKLAAALEGLR